MYKKHGKSKTLNPRNGGTTQLFDIVVLRLFLIPRTVFSSYFSLAPFSPMIRYYYAPVE